MAGEIDFCQGLLRCKPRVLPKHTARFALNFYSEFIGSYTPHKSKRVQQLRTKKNSLLVFSPQE